ncbi:hypothetical protein C8J57DRAFT_1235923 [Mycena rebaudengoi]|nr:hypothetical protein C8J57DRAFT_1235923 [Mycena rebaudengoi]
MLEWIQFWNMSRTSLAEVVEHQREAQCFDQVCMSSAEHCGVSSMAHKSQWIFGEWHKALTQAAKRLEWIQFWNLSQTSLVEVLELRREAQSFTAKLKTIDTNDFQAKFGKEPKLGQPLSNFAPGLQKRALLHRNDDFFVERESGLIFALKFICVYNFELSCNQD